MPHTSSLFDEAKDRKDAARQAALDYTPAPGEELPPIQNGIVYIGQDYSAAILEHAFAKYEGIRQVYVDAHLFPLNDIVPLVQKVHSALNKVQNIWEGVLVHTSDSINKALSADPNSTLYRRTDLSFAEYLVQNRKRIDFVQRQKSNGLSLG